MYSFLAETQPSGIGSSLFFWISLVLIIAVFYFLVIRPQKKQEREANALKNSLQVGDEVTTIGGIVGVVVRVKDDIFTLVTSKERTRISFQRSALRSIDRRNGEPFNPAPVATPKKVKGAKDEEKTEAPAEGSTSSEETK